MSALAGADPLSCSSPEIIDLTPVDAVSEQIGRQGYLVDLTVDGCLIPDDRGGHEPAIFSRCYFATEGEEVVLVDVLAGGSEHEVSQQEAAQHTVLKREFCEAQGYRYVVHVNDSLLAAFS